MESKIRHFKIGLFFLFVFFAVSCSFVMAKQDTFIRIAIMKDADSAIIAIRGYYEIMDPETNFVYIKDRVLKKSVIKPADSGIYIGKKFYKTKHLRLIPRKDVLVLVGEKYRRYRGEMDIVLLKDEHIALVNVLDIESYVKGVLYHEISHRWPMESMKAQAIAARTYAFYQIQKNKEQYFDVTSDIYSQMYGGRNAEKFRTNLAVDRTKGQVITYQGSVLPAYFHSNCGGHTENAANLWDHDLVPLRGVECPYCKNAPGYNWKKNLQLSEIQRLLNNAGHKIGLIKDIKILKKNESGRIEKLKIDERGGGSIIISGKDFRQIMGPNNIRSNKYDIVMAGYFVDFTGKGWGHGVGMCQWGAYEMGRRKIKYDSILQFYYPQIEIKKISELID